MIFDPNQTEFLSDYQRIVWQYGLHIVPTEVSLADVDDPETREGCLQVYDCTMEILEDMYKHPEEYSPERPRWYTGDYLAWLLNGSRPIKHHRDNFTCYIQKIPQFGFCYDEDTQTLSNTRYPLFTEYFGALAQLAKERKQNLGGYLDRRDFRLFAKRIVLSPDDLLRPLSDVEKRYFLEMHAYAIAKGMKAEMKDSYTFRYTYKKLYSLVLHNNPARITVPYGQFESFMEIVDAQPDRMELIAYIKKELCACDACGGAKTAATRCKNAWIYIDGARRLPAGCHRDIGKWKAAKSNLTYSEYDVQMLKRMMDIRVAQIDNA